MEAPSVWHWNNDNLARLEKLGDLDILVVVGDKILDQVVGDLWSKASNTIKATCKKHLDFILRACLEVTDRDNVKNTFDFGYPITIYKVRHSQFIFRIL